MAFWIAVGAGWWAASGAMFIMYLIDRPSPKPATWADVMIVVLTLPGAAMIGAVVLAACLFKWAYRVLDKPIVKGEQE